MALGEAASRKVRQALCHLGVTAFPPSWQYRVALSAHPAWIETAAGQEAFFAAANLVCRLHPLITHVDIALPGRVPNCTVVPLLPGDDFAETLVDFLGSIGTLTEVTRVEQVREAESILALGPVPVPSDRAATCYFESVGWVAHLTRRAETLVEPWQGSSPIGAFLAGGLVAAEAVKHTLLRITSIPTVQVVTDELWFSAWDYRWRHQTMPGNGPDLPDTLDVGRITVAGVGSGGMATIMALASCRMLRGTISLVDPDEVTSSNLDRLPGALLRHATTRAPKVDVAAQILEGKGAELIPLAEAWNKVNRQLRHLGMLQCVVSTVDNAPARWEIQADLPRDILDAATNQSGEFFLTRVRFGQTCCLGCIYEPDPSRDNEDRLLANALGLPITDISNMVRDNAAFTKDQVARIRKSHQLPQGATLPTEGQRISDWRGQHCTQLRLPSDTIVPLAPVTFLPGVLLAGELVKRNLSPKSMLDNRYVWNVLRLPASHYPHVRSPRPGCNICGDSNYRTTYDREWGATSRTQAS
ncbi:MAG: ThiF family adenylyltransferase [Bacillota bacterium]